MAVVAAAPTRVESRPKAESKSLLGRRASVHLDVIRAVSALAVAIGHVRGLFFVEYLELPHRSAFFALLYGVTGLGRQAVMVFFVLSGFFIASSVVRAFLAGRWSWRIYLVNRVTRLQLVLLPALLLGAMWDLLGMRWLLRSSLYYHPIPNFFTDSVAAHENATNFFGNLFFLQSLIFPTFGSNGPLWSLSYEFWYYMLFPALVFVLFARVRILVRLAYLVVALVICWLMGPRISLYFLIWLGGALIALGPRLSLLQHASWNVAWRAATGLFFLAVLAFSKMKWFPTQIASDFAVGLAFMPFMYVLVHSRREDVTPSYARIGRLGAGFSYTLYLTHFPLLLFFRAWLIRDARWQFDVRHSAYAVLISAVVVAYAYLIASFTEARTEAARSKVLLLLSHRRKGAVL